MTATSRLDQTTTPVRVPMWPILVAPIVAAIYYIAVKLAFAQSIVPVLGRLDFFDIPIPRWGPHWIYRATSEVIATGFGTFIAAGLAPGRERIAAIVGGCAISVGFIAKLFVTYLAWRYEDADRLVLLDPWYQQAIDVAMIIGAPFIGSYVAEAAEDMHHNTPKGFGGINRFHFIWLWFAAYCYSIGLITPVARYYAFQDEGILTSLILLLINGIPAAAIAVPGYYGIAFLAGHHGETMHPAGRNLVGVLVLIFGFLVGLLIEDGWYWIVQKIFEFIFV